jgi:hypothetical protein
VGTVGQITGGMAEIDLADNPFYSSFSDTVHSTNKPRLCPICKVQAWAVHWPIMQLPIPRLRRWGWSMR